MNTPCPFNASSKSFRGTPAEQVACLLRRVRVLGNVDDAPGSIPDALLTRVGRPVDFTRADLAIALLVALFGASLGFGGIL